MWEPPISCCLNTILAIHSLKHFQLNKKEGNYQVPGKINETYIDVYFSLQLPLIFDYSNFGYRADVTLVTEKNFKNEKRRSIRYCEVDVV